MDPFLSARAETERLRSVWQATAQRDGNDTDETYDAFHRALAVAIETEPATLAGYAAKLDLLTEDPYGEGEPLCGWAFSHSELWRERIQAALTSTAKMLRKLIVAP